MYFIPKVMGGAWVQVLESQGEIKYFWKAILVKGAKPCLHPKSKPDHPVHYPDPFYRQHLWKVITPPLDTNLFQYADHWLGPPWIEAQLTEQDMENC